MAVRFPHHLRSLRDRHLTKVSQALASAGIISPKVIHPWRDDPAFVALMNRIRSRTIVDDMRCYLLLQLALQTRSLAGDVAEIGVYRGGTARLLAETLCPYDKTIHLFDTLGGHPKAAIRRHLKSGHRA